MLSVMLLLMLLTTGGTRRSETRKKCIELKGGCDIDDHENDGVVEETVEILVINESTILQD